MMRTLTTFMLTAAALLGATPAARAAIIYVDDSAAGGANDGSSWANAFVDLQQALVAAKPGDEIRVGQGVYKPAPPGGPRAATFSLPDGVNLQGGYAGTGAANPDALDPEHFETILSGDLNDDDSITSDTLDDNSYHVVTADGVSAQTRLAGFVIEAGRADLMDGCGSTGTHDRGGGFVGRNGAQNLVENCVFRLNAAVCYGGGAFLGEDPPVPTVRRCTFLMNRMTPSAGLGAGAALSSFEYCVVEACLFIGNGDTVNGTTYGGAAHVFGGAFRRCDFINNRAQESAGALSGANLLIDCRFIGNGAQHGGAVSTHDVEIINCEFLGNQGNCGSPTGASAVNANGTVQIVNSVFSGNEGGLGAVHFPNASSESRTVINSTFIANTAACFPGVAGGLSGPTNQNLQISNCIFWDNAGSETSGQSHQLNAPAGSVHNSIVQDWDGSLGGPGNTGDDPELIDPNGPDNLYGTADDNARLSALSPARDSGDNAALPPDTFDLDGDGNTKEPIPFDLDFRRRVANGIVDRGAFEIQTCPADIAPVATQGDGAIDVNDLLLMIGSWGACDIPCAADIAPVNSPGDGSVDVNDLLLLIGAWGSCP